MRPLVIYHALCSDGAGAAYAAWRKFGDDAEYRPASYGDPAPTSEEVAGRDVFVLDFSYARPELERIGRTARSVTLIDHHLSAKKALEPLTQELANVKRIALAGGGFAYIDAVDFDTVKNYSWSRATNGGAIAYTGGGRKAQAFVYMHQLILPAEKGKMIDHKNRNTLDNRRSNLRVATRQQNAANMDRGSKYKGITFTRNRWQAQIMVNYKRIGLGSYDDPIEAAKAYDQAALQYFGEFARTNFDIRKESIPLNIEIVFDMHHSGAVLAWRHFHGAEPVPEILLYIEDRDLWRWQLPNSRAVSAALEARNVLRDFRCLVQLAGPVGDLAAEGAALLRQQQLYVDALASLGLLRRGLLGDTPHYVVNSYLLHSEVGNVLATRGASEHRAPLAAVWHQGCDGRFKVSLRSIGDCDVAAIAERFGGGGHKNAASFYCDALPWKDM